VFCCALLCQMFNCNIHKAPFLNHCLLSIASLGLLLLIMLTAGNYPEWVEHYYSQTVYHLISQLWHFLLSWLPFSLGDVFYVIVIICLLHISWKLLCYGMHKQLKYIGKAVLNLTVGIQLFIIAFYLLWGMNYFRPPAAKLLQLPVGTYTLSELQAITTLIIDSANASRATLTTAQLNTQNAVIYQKAALAIQHIGSEHPALQSFYPTVKPSMFTPLLNYLGTAGYFNPFSSEAQINYEMPLVNRPVTACHEMAHQIGFAREDEANFVGFIAGIQSPDRLLRYSAYYLAMDELMHQVHQRDTLVFHELKKRISIPVSADLKAERLYWLHYQNQLGRLSSLFYDRFLKINNQPEGLRTYNRMINLTIAYYRSGKKLGNGNWKSIKYVNPN